MNIGIGCDEAGFRLKQSVMELLLSMGHSVTDYGCYDETPVSYPDVAYEMAHRVTEGEVERGILICGTGIGMCITANKVPGIRAAVCHDSFSTIRSRCSNDAQIMCMGARVIGVELAKQLVELWLQYDFAGGNSTAKVERISQLERME